MRSTSTLVFGLVFGLGMAGSGAFAEAPRTPLTVEIRLPETLPALGEPFEIAATVASRAAAPGTTVHLHATPGVRLLGRRSFVVDLAAGEEHAFAATAVVDATGDHTIRVRARRVVDRENEIWGDLAAAHFHTTPFSSALGHAPVENGGVVLEVPPADGDPAFIEIGPEKGLVVSPDLVAPVPPPIPLDPDGSVEPGGGRADLLGGVTVTVRLRGRDPNDTQIDVGEMLGEILNADTNAHIAYFFTDGTGEGTASFANPGAAGFYVRWWAYIDWGTGGTDDNQMVIRPSATASWTEAHKVWTGGFVRSDGAHDLGTYAIAAGENRRGAFSLLNDLNDAFRYIWFAGLNRSSEGVHVEWEADSLHGTHYHAGGEVHLEGDDWGTPANLPPSDTMVHEYGHAVMYNVYGDVFPPHDCPSPHFIQGTSETVCAWTEGFADFLVVPVNGDSSYDWPSGSSLDLETPTWGTPGWDSDDSVEGRVAGALVDIFDGTNEGTDSITRGFDEIWDTFYSQNDDTFLQFFTAWRNLGYGDCFTDAAIHQNTIDYDSAPVIAGLPDVACAEDAFCNDLVDLWAFASDIECTDSQLSFSISGSTNPSAGVSISGDRFIDVNPADDFAGSSIVTVRVTDTAGKTDTDSFVVTITNVNDPPDRPDAPSGESDGIATVSMQFRASAEDIDGDPVQIRFDWGDGTVSAYSALGISGQIQSMNHTYASEGTYLVRAQARDLGGLTSIYSVGLSVDIADNVCRYGNVDADNGGGPVPVLFVNGSAGNAVTRETAVGEGLDIEVVLNSAPAGPAGPRFAIWGFPGKPTSASDRALPFNAGTMCMNPILSSCGTSVCAIYAANTIGKCTKALCSTPEATGTGANTVILRIPGGVIPAGQSVTFQGVVKDLSDVDSTLQYSVTNAVIVTVAH